MKSLANKKLYERIAELNEQLKEAKNENLILKQSQKELEELRYSHKKVIEEYQKAKNEYQSLIDELQSLKKQYKKDYEVLLKRLSKTVN